MDCNDAEERFTSFILGALDSEERELMDSHLDSCSECSEKLQEDGETISNLAQSVPPLEVPPEVKARLISKIEGRSRPVFWRNSQSRLQSLLSSIGLSRSTQRTSLVASAFAIVLIVGGVWFNSRLNSVSTANAELSERIDALIQRDSQVMDAMKEQRNFTYEALQLSATPGTSVNILNGATPSFQGQGMLLVSSSGTFALIFALNLPPLDSQYVYQIWMTRGSERYGAGNFRVDATGWGEAVIFPLAPFAEYDSVEITIEPAGNRIAPTGARVLKGDL